MPGVGGWVGGEDGDDDTAWVGGSGALLRPRTPGAGLARGGVASRPAGAALRAPARPGLGNLGSLARSSSPAAAPAAAILCSERARGRLRTLGGGVARDPGS